MMHIIGLTGGIGSGKSEAARQLSSLGVPIIDLDVIAKGLLEKNTLGYQLLVKGCGESILNNEREIDRKKLQSLMFNNVAIKNEVELILHPMIHEQCLKQIEQCATSLYLVVVVPLLFESNAYLDVIHESLLIDCNIENQKNRTQKRDGVTPNIVEKIIASQASRQERLQKADNIINNDGLLEEFLAKIVNFHKLTLQKLGK